jgi:hypothetical protein
MRELYKALSSQGEQREKRNENNRAINPLNPDLVDHLAPSGKSQQEKLLLFQDTSVMGFHICQSMHKLAKICVF